MAATPSWRRAGPQTWALCRRTAAWRIRRPSPRLRRCELERTLSHWTDQGLRPLSAHPPGQKSPSARSDVVASSLRASCSAASCAARRSSSRTPGAPPLGPRGGATEATPACALGGFTCAGKRSHRVWRRTPAGTPLVLVSCWSHTTKHAKSLLKLVQVNHHYVGGYYGAASEEEMKQELVPGMRIKRPS